MSAHTVINPCEADVPEDILKATMDFAASAPRPHEIGFLQACRIEALRQHRREQIIRTKGVIHGAMAMQGLPPDPEQAEYQADHDDYEYEQRRLVIP